MDTQNKYTKNCEIVKNERERNNEMLDVCNCVLK